MILFLLSETQKHISNKIDQTKENYVAAILANFINPDIVQASLYFQVVANTTVAYSLKRSFDPQFYYISSIIAAVSGTISYCCGFGFNTPQYSRQTNIRSGALYLQACAEMYVALTNLTHRNIFPFNFAEDMKLQKLVDISKRLPKYYKSPNYNVRSGELLITI